MCLCVIILVCSKQKSLYIVFSAKLLDKTMEVKKNMSFKQSYLKRSPLLLQTKNGPLPS